MAIAIYLVALNSGVLQVALLAENPRPVTCKKLQGADDLYRIRVADYRIVYSINDAILVIEIIRIGHRSKIYQQKFNLL